MFTVYFLKLTLAHLPIRFVLEPRMPAPRRYVGVPAAKGFLAAILLSPELYPPMLLSIAVFAVVGALIDLLERTSSRPAWASFSAAQFAQVLLSGATALWWSSSGGVDSIGNTLRGVASDTDVLWVITVYFGTVFLGGVLVQNIAAHFRRHLQETPDSQRPGLQDAGRYIGWLERFLILTFVFGGFGDAIGFLLAAKALVRYPEMQDKSGLFAEYFLVGTLTSVGLALLGGFVLRWATA